MLSGLLAVLYLMSGVPKLAGVEQIVKEFAKWGYPGWFRLVVGTVEVASAVLLLIPRVAFFGASALAVIMIGAIHTHVFRGTNEAGMAVVPLLLLVFLAIVGYARRPASLRRETPA